MLYCYGQEYLSPQSPGPLFPNKTDSGNVQTCSLSVPTAQSAWYSHPGQAPHYSPGRHQSPSCTLSTLTVASGDEATTAAHHWVEMSPVRLRPRPLSHRKLGLNLEHVELLVGEAVRVNCLSLTSP